MNYPIVDTFIAPEGQLELLSRTEVAKMLDTSQSGLHQIFRNCALAVLNCGNSLDDGKILLERYRDFSIEIVQRDHRCRIAQPDRQ